MKSSPLPRFLRRFIFGLVYLLPAVLFCSYHPVIRLGSDASMNFELSLPLIWLVVFDLATFSAMLLLRRPRELPGISDRRIFLFALFPLFATISIFWSANPLRAVLTAGIIWLVFFAAFAIIYLLPLFSPPSAFRRHVLASLFLSSTAVCIICWVQCFLDLAGLSRNLTLLCLGCTYRSFGFPHPSGLAIEPQFMGNLLLAPALTALYLLIFRRPRAGATSRRDTCFLFGFASIFSATLFLTFSRGAIYAYAIALAILLLFALIRRVFRPSLILIPVATFLLTLCMQGIFAAMSPTPDTFISGVTKSIHQLSLGLIDLRPHAPTSPSSDDQPTVITDVEDIVNHEEAEHTRPDSDLDQTTANLEHDASIFEGYVAESTNIRLDLNATAIETWISAPHTVAIGVGLGGAGTAMHAAYPDRVTSPKEIVQNQVFSILVELGVVGIFLVHFGLILAFFAPLLPAWLIDGRRYRERHPDSFRTEDRHHGLRGYFSRLRLSDFWSHPALPLLASLIVAYIITLSFFSGLPNALHIYLLPPLLYLIFRENPCNP